MLLVFKLGAYIGMVRLIGHKARSRVTADDVRASLAGALDDDEVDQLLRVSPR